MGRRSRSYALRAGPGLPTAARESLERRWFERMVWDDSLAALVTASGAVHEPFHRWIHYRQGYSPELVRRFLKETVLETTRDSSPVLDPFAGSGTCVVECARHRVRAIGVERLAPLVFLTNVKAETEFPPFPDLGEARGWEEVASQVEHPLHRAALMLAEARRHNSDGALNRNAPPLAKVLDETIRMIRDDLLRPLPFCNEVACGDARDMAHLESESVAAILTSPPYLSRHDYSRITRPYEMIYRTWQDLSSHSPAQTSTALTRFRSIVLPEVVAEVCQALILEDRAKPAKEVKTYFADMFQVLLECGRVLGPGGALWLVIGGARLKGVYVPTDLILAEYAEQNGFAFESHRVARRLIDTGRKLGTLSYVTPRESLVVLRKQ